MREDIFEEFGSSKKDKKVEYGSELYQSIAIEYAIYDDLIFVAEKFGIDIKEMETLITKKEFQKQTERVKEELRRKQMDALAYKKKLLAMKALDEVASVAFGPDSRSKLGALRTLLELSDDLSKGKVNDEKDTKENQVVLNIRKEQRKKD